MFLKDAVSIVASSKSYEKLGYAWQLSTALDIFVFFVFVTHKVLDI